MVRARRQPRVRVLLLSPALALAAALALMTCEGVGPVADGGGLGLGRRLQAAAAVTSCTTRVEQVAVFTDPGDALEYTVFRLYVEVHDAALANIYALYGSAGSPLAVPPAYQVAPPFGSDFGGVNPQLVEVIPTAAYDSWLTVGLADGDLSSQLAVSAGFFSGDGGEEYWTADRGIRRETGSVAYTNPALGASERDVLVAQLTCAADHMFTAVLNVRGQSANGTWEQEGLSFECAPLMEPSPPPSPTPLPADEPCLSSPCQHEGSCIDSSSRSAIAAGYYLCTCRAGFVGEDCEIDEDECESTPCRHGSVCTESGSDGQVAASAYTCQCGSNSGYGGDNCDQDVDECESSPCNHDGACVDQLASYACRCAAGWAGSTCDDAMNACVLAPCLHGGVCFSAARLYLCECEDGYRGQNCDVSVSAAVGPALPPIVPPPPPPYSAPPPPPSCGCAPGQTQICCTSLTPSCMACLRCCTPEQWCQETGSTDTECSGVAAHGGGMSAPSPPGSGATTASSAGATRRPARVLPLSVPPETAFRTSDMDADNYLSMDEATIGLTVLNGGQAPNMTWISTLDANGDSRIGWIEFKSAVDANDGNGAAVSTAASGSAGEKVEQLPACEDNLDDCEGWADDGECEKNSAFMRVRCQMSCLAQLPTALCVDPDSLAAGGQAARGGVGMSFGASAAMAGVVAVVCALACLGCRKNCRKSDVPYTPGSNRKNLLGKARDNSGGDYAMVALDEGLSDAEDPAAAQEESDVARVLNAADDDDAAAAAAEVAKKKDAAPPISTDFLADEGGVDDWLAAEPTKKEKHKVDYSSYG